MEYDEEAFAEIDEILQLMPIELSSKIPVQFRKIILENKAKDYNVKINQTMFHRTPNEVKAIIETCNLNRLKITGTMFLRNPKELKTIITLLKRAKMNFTATALNRSPDEILELFRICKGYVLYN